MQQEIEPFLSLYERTFPQRKRVQLLTCSNISTGWEGDLFSFALAYEEEHVCKHEEIVLKLYYGQDGIQKAEKEWWCLRHMGKIGYPVPHPLFVALHDSPFGRAGVAMEKIPGRTAEDLFDHGSQEARQDCMTRCCQLYVSLHTLNWQLLLPASKQRRKEDIIPSWLANAKSRSNQWLPGAFDPILDWLQSQSTGVHCHSLSVTHGDFHLNNILARDDGTLFVIDWTGPDISDYRFDLAWTLMLQRTQGKTEQADMMQATYEHVANHSLEHLEFFEVTACFKRLFDIAVSLQNGATILGMKPGAEEEMKQQADHIQTVYTMLQQYVASPLPYIEQLISSLNHQSNK